LIDTNYLEAILNGSELNGIWKDCLDSYEHLDNSDKIECLGQTISLRDHIIDVLKDITDASERDTCIGLFYLVIKTEWMLLNTQYTYQMDARRVDHRNVCRAGLFSALLGAIEEHCRPADIKRIEALLAQLPNSEDTLDENPETGGLRVQIQALREALSVKEKALSVFQEEWHLLEMGLGRKTAREIVECVRELKDDVLQLQRNGGSTLPEKYVEFDREFGGLNARQIALQIERLDMKVKSLEKEAQVSTEGQELLLKELGDADPQRLIVRFQELQNQVTNLTLELARAKSAPTPKSLHTGSDEGPDEDISVMLGNLESALLALNN
jgi:hypothetical protein